ncbi:MAG: hypothetical protein N4A47_01545 [Clostridia bacterium]|jgi:tetratricopeptide (TPR) repeat protein|nr:hypothetical protein [Clostridia bacterium]
MNRKIIYTCVLVALAIVLLPRIWGYKIEKLFVPKGPITYYTADSLENMKSEYKISNDILMGDKKIRLLLNYDSVLVILLENSDEVIVYDQITLLERLNPYNVAFDYDEELKELNVTTKDNMSNESYKYNFKITGNSLNYNGVEINDEAIVYFKNVEASLNSNSFDEAAGYGGVSQNVVYPEAYQEEIYKLGRLAMIESHDYALEIMDSSENYKEALDIMVYGFEEYYKSQVAVEDDFEKNIETNISKLYIEYEKKDQGSKYQLKKEVFTQYVNDIAYAYYKNNKFVEAEKLLDIVLAENDERVVAYINMGDVKYALDKKEESYEYYKKYVDFLGEKNKIIPKRVHDRIEESFNN